MMTIVFTLAKTVINFFLVQVILIAAASPRDITFYIGALIAVVMGFLMRVMMDVKANRFTWKDSAIQGVISICLSYLCLMAYQDVAPRFRIEYYLFACSFLSVFIASVIEKALKLGIPGVARLLLNHFTAMDPKTKPEELK